MEKNKDNIFELVKTLREYYPDNFNVKTVVYDFYNKTDNISKAY